MRFIPHAPPPSKKRKIVRGARRVKGVVFRGRMKVKNRVFRPFVFTRNKYEKSLLYKLGTLYKMGKLYSQIAVWEKRCAFRRIAHFHHGGCTTPKECTIHEFPRSRPPESRAARGFRTTG
jgi:hypothetical protein